MSVPVFKKNSKDYYPIRIHYLNEDGVTNYVVNSLSVTSENIATGANSLSLVVDTAQNSYTENKAMVWVKDGVVGEMHRLEITATMSTGEKITKTLTLQIVN